MLGRGVSVMLFHRRISFGEGYVLPVMAAMNPAKLYRRVLDLLALFKVVGRRYTKIRPPNDEHERRR